MIVLIFTDLLLAPGRSGDTGVYESRIRTVCYAIFIPDDTVDMEASLSPIFRVSDRAARRTNTKTRTNRKRGETHTERATLTHKAHVMMPSSSLWFQEHLQCEVCNNT